MPHAHIRICDARDHEQNVTNPVEYLVRTKRNRRSSYRTNRTVFQFVSTSRVCSVCVYALDGLWICICDIATNDFHSSPVVLGLCAACVCMRVYTIVARVFVIRSEHTKCAVQVFSLSTARVRFKLEAECKLESNKTQLDNVRTASISLTGIERPSAGNHSKQRDSPSIANCHKIYSAYFGTVALLE